MIQIRKCKFRAPISMLEAPTNMLTLFQFQSINKERARKKQVWPNPTVSPEQARGDKRMWREINKGRRKSAMSRDTRQRWNLSWTRWERETRGRGGEGVIEKEEIRSIHHDSHGRLFYVTTSIGPWERCRRKKQMITWLIIICRILKLINFNYWLIW